MTNPKKTVTTSHTPGPWTTQPIGDETESNILGARRELIATVSDNDACVIAAGPEMLEALCRAETLVELCMDGDAPAAASPMLRDMLDEFRAIIAKATGERR